jgi:hypothetical protein
VLPRLERLSRIFGSFGQLKDRLSAAFDCAAALATVDPAAARERFRSALPRISELNASDTGASPFFTLIADLTGGMSGSQFPRADVCAAAAVAFVTAARAAPGDWIALAEPLLDGICGIESPNDRAMALARFFAACAQATPELNRALAPHYARALAATADLSPRLRGHVFQQAVAAFCRLGEFDQAQAAAEASGDAAGHDVAISSARDLAQVRPLTPFEEAYAGVESRDFAAIVLHAVKSGGPPEGAREIPRALGLLILEHNPVRHFLLSDRLRLLMLPMRASGGIEALQTLVARIEEFDRRFLQAAASIASS